MDLIDRIIVNHKKEEKLWRTGMENNNNNYQNLSRNAQPYANMQQGYDNNMQPFNTGQPYNTGKMQSYNPGQPSITYNVTHAPITENNLPEEFKPISAWGYVGYNLLFSIPLIGLIMVCVYAFGGTNKINVRNYARSFFCVFLIIIVIYILLFVTGGFSALLSGNR